MDRVTRLDPHILDATTARRLGTSRIRARLVPCQDQPRIAASRASIWKMDTVGTSSCACLLMVAVVIRQPKAASCCVTWSIRDAAPLA